MSKPVTVEFYETPNGGKLIKDLLTNTIFAIVDLAPAKENMIIPTTVTWSGTDNFDVWSQFNKREPKDIDVIAMLDNISTTNQDAYQKVVAKYFIETIYAQVETEF
jgi:hypothetical protein